VRNIEFAEDFTGDKREKIYITKTTIECQVHRAVYRFLFSGWFDG
jgi:hypothetical protein